MFFYKCLSCPSCTIFSCNVSSCNGFSCNGFSSQCLPFLNSNCAEICHARNRRLRVDKCQVELHLTFSFRYWIIENWKKELEFQDSKYSTRFSCWTQLHHQKRRHNILITQITGVISWIQEIGLGQKKFLTGIPEFRETISLVFLNQEMKK
jgi:hypothetical protein